MKIKILSLMLALILLMSCFTFIIPVSAADEDYINGTWIFNDATPYQIGITETTTYDVLFESSGYEYVQMQFIVDSIGTVSGIYYIRDTGAITEAYEGGWGNTNFKTVTLKNAVDSNGEFATVLNSIAAKDTSNEITFAVNGAIYTCTNGMTFEEFCNSSYNTKMWYINDVTDVNGTTYANRVVISTTDYTTIIVGLNGNNVIASSTLIQANASYGTLSITTAEETDDGSSSGGGSTDDGDSTLPVIPEIDATKYSSVLEDLQADSSFDVNNYPAVADEYSMNLFQIAESSDGELFLYVYNPSADNVFLEAKYVNMALQHYENADPTYKLYSLNLISSEGTLAKYLVNGLSVSESSTRYYNIAGIYTPYNSNVHDAASADDDVKNYVGVPVSKCFAAYYYNNSLRYEAVKVDVVDLDIVSVGTIRYTDGVYLNGYDMCDSHYLAFKVNNFDITHIYDGTISYTTQSYKYTLIVGGDITETYGDPVTVSKDIFDYEYGSNDGSGPFGKKYTWNRILTVDAFKKQLEDITNEKLVYSEGALDSAEFVFQFLETDYSSTFVTGVSQEQTKTIVTEEAVLRLHFATPYGVYNLGVVSDIVSDDGEPDFIVTPGDNAQNNVEDAYDKLLALLDGLMDFQGEAFEGIFGLIVIVIVVFFVIYILPYIKKGIDYIFGGVVSLFETVVTVFVMPFAFVGELFGASSTKNKKSKKKRGKRK